jgi:hypothetical protein
LLFTPEEAFRTIFCQYSDFLYHTASDDNQLK